MHIQPKLKKKKERKDLKKKTSQETSLKYLTGVKEQS